MNELFPGVFKQGKKLYTVNAAPGKSVYGEQRIKIGEKEYRFWDPYRSKPAAAILRGLKNFPIKPGISLLYLGVANGTTASHFSDIIGRGAIFGIDVAPKMFEKLLEVCKDRKNIIPILADANKPEQYSDYVGKVDVIYQDVAQPNQIEILLENVKAYLKPTGIAMIAIKARSIDFTKDPKVVFSEELEKLKKEMRVLETVDLKPYELDHIIAVSDFFKQRK